MEMREAIELLGTAYKTEYDFEHNYIPNTKLMDGVPKIIELLQRGKKYEQMWGELYEIASEFNFFPLMDKLEQKYFPKEL